MPTSDQMVKMLLERVRGLGPNGLDILFCLTGADHVLDERDADITFFDGIGDVVVGWRNASAENRTEVAATLYKRVHGKEAREYDLADYNMLITRACNIIWYLAKNIKIVTAQRDDTLPENLDPSERDIQELMMALGKVSERSTFEEIRGRFPGLVDEVQEEN